MNEKQLHESIRQICRSVGVLMYHTYDSRRCAPGYPDLTLVGPRGVMWRELKTDRGKISPHQQRWLQALRTAGANADIWRVADLRKGRVVAEVRELTHPRNPGRTQLACDSQEYEE